MPFEDTYSFVPFLSVAFTAEKIKNYPFFGERMLAGGVDLIILVTLSGEQHDIADPSLAESRPYRRLAPLDHAAVRAVGYTVNNVEYYRARVFRPAVVSGYYYKIGESCGYSSHDRTL